MRVKNQSLKYKHETGVYKILDPHIFYIKSV